jgi:hypothetical protein
MKGKGIVKGADHGLWMVFLKVDDAEKENLSKHILKAESAGRI